jgi:hypothetical protein
VGLLPFAHRTVSLAATARGYAATMAAIAAAANATVTAAAKRAPAHDGGRTPKSPTGPPGDAGAGGIAGAPGGVAAGVWCALLLSCLLYLAQELRRHRVRLSLPAPAGVVLLLHRPG